MDDVSISRATTQDSAPQWGQQHYRGMLRPVPRTPPPMVSRQPNIYRRSWGRSSSSDIAGGFYSEWQPSTPTEACLVEELARHAAALERATPIEEAVLRTSARGLSRIAESDLDEDAGADRVLAAACGTETVDRVTRVSASA